MGGGGAPGYRIYLLRRFHGVTHEMAWLNGEDAAIA